MVGDAFETPELAVIGLHPFLPLMVAFMALYPLVVSSSLPALVAATNAPQCLQRLAAAFMLSCITMAATTSPDLDKSCAAPHACPLSADHVAGALLLLCIAWCACRCMHWFCVNERVVLSTGAVSRDTLLVMHAVDAFERASTATPCGCCMRMVLSDCQDVKGACERLSARVDLLMQSCPFQDPACTFPVHASQSSPLTSPNTLCRCVVVCEIVTDVVDLDDVAAWTTSGHLEVNINQSKDGNSNRQDVKDHLDVPTSRRMKLPSPLVSTTSPENENHYDPCGKSGWFGGKFSAVIPANPKARRRLKAVLEKESDARYHKWRAKQELLGTDLVACYFCRRFSVANHVCSKGPPNNLRDENSRWGKDQAAFLQAGVDFLSSWLEAGACNDEHATPSHALLDDCDVAVGGRGMLLLGNELQANYAEEVSQYGGQRKDQRLRYNKMLNSLASLDKTQQ